MTDMKVTGALVFILAVNVMFFLGQTVVTKINPDGPQFFNEDDYMIGEYNNGNYTLDENVANELPGTEVAVSPEDQTGGGYFTDIWSSLKSWFTDTTIGRGATYLLNVVNGFPHFLSLIGTPREIVFAIGFFWHSLTVFLFAVFLKGGQ
jgi:hypothetical protein